MSDSKLHDLLDATGGRDSEQRIEAIRRWVEYIESEPPETWGPQQNAVVDGQLDAAQQVGASAAHRRQVRETAEAILDERDGADGDST